MDISLRKHAILRIFESAYLSLMCLQMFSTAIVVHSGAASSFAGDAQVNVARKNVGSLLFAGEQEKNVFHLPGLSGEVESHGKVNIVVDAI